MSVSAGLSRLLGRLRGHRSTDDFRSAGAQIGERFLGNGVEINKNDCPFVSIGDDVVCGPGVLILAHDASFRAGVGYTRVRRVSIGDRVFIGARATVLPGTVVGDGAIIGACSLVTGNVPAGEVWGGVPAKRLSSVDDLLRKGTASIETAPRFEAGWKESFKDDERRSKLAARVDLEGWFY